ncbi:hypothetical protein K1T71_014313 [Dendrolimus kikuchii]|uniref:Uncharacterized protein n=1 Tax=Dendrolimus kikuchii TaxID=765133 RepID=A0ACC1CFK6_9NEOP|nr:hypothetical protein K1T71_014313 [Dendrolimus kikuchii]
MLRRFGHVGRMTKQIYNAKVDGCRSRGRPRHTFHDQIDRVLAEELGIDHKTVLLHLKKAGYTKKLDIWVPHELTERNLMNRVLICDSLLRRNETEPFLKKLITSDEKWITYDKNVRKISWS